MCVYVQHTHTHTHMHTLTQRQCLANCTPETQLMNPTSLSYVFLISSTFTLSWCSSLQPCSWEKFLNQFLIPPEDSKLPRMLNC